MTNHAETAVLPLLTEIADPSLLRQAAKLVKQNLAEWRFDPEIADVAGLIDLTPNHGRQEALVVVYLVDYDFAVADRFFDLVDHFGL